MTPLPSLGADICKATSNAPTSKRQKLRIFPFETVEMMWREEAKWWSSPKKVSLTTHTSGFPILFLFEHSRCGNIWAEMRNEQASFQTCILHPDGTPTGVQLLRPSSPPFQPHGHLKAAARQKPGTLQGQSG